ncbi:hypothetical protein [Evansella clarkii]|uniref:hypothetical protein n=1 Tax=Evansella clarkii TaxID=79879 RepID=UPI00147301C1|nr:hypothetical protein [Evansella clarkii]
MKEVQVKRLGKSTGQFIGKFIIGSLAFAFFYFGLYLFAELPFEALLILLLTCIIVDK